MIYGRRQVAWRSADRLGLNGDVISVITPSYNQAQFLEETILSVLGQDYPNLEYIVVDGGSTDGSVEIIKKYADRLAYWVSEPDRGQSHAINKGLERATGEIVAWLNSDDLYCPGTLSTVARYFAEHPEVAVVYGNSEYVAEDGKHLGYYPARPYDRRALFGQFAGDIANYIPQPSVFMRLEAPRPAQLVDERLRYALDYDLWGRLARYYQFGCISQTLSRYRLTPTAKTSSLRLRGAAEMAVVLHRYGTAKSLLRAIVFYASEAARAGIAPHQATAQLVEIFAQCGQQVARRPTHYRLLLAAMYAGLPINWLLPLWSRVVSSRQRVRSLGNQAQEGQGQMFFYGADPDSDDSSPLDRTVDEVEHFRLHPSWVG